MRDTPIERCVDSVLKLTPRPGFALVISIVLMAFIFLLLVSLASMVMVETNSYAATIRQQEARNNALLALHIAIGELQKQAGADMRVTAQAMILDTDPGTEAVEGIEHPYWTGVWKANAITGAPELLTWLVSGNESLNPSDGDFLSAESAELDDTDSVVLVETGVNSGTVRAKCVATERGHYAYWVSGEQSKAKINRVDDSVTEPVVSDDFPRTLARQYQFFHLGLSSQPMLSNEVNRAQTFGQMSVALGLGATASDSFKEYFHDVTTVSEGLLTDAASGGLKVDLSALLAADLPEDYDGQSIYVASEAIRSDAWATQAPSWNYLKSYYELREDVLADGKLTPRPGTQDVPGISPVIAMFSFGFSGGIYSESGNPEHPDNNRAFFNLFPKLVLYNPYSVTLAGRNYGLVLWGNQVASGELSGSISSYYPVFKGVFYNSGSKTYETGVGFVHAQGSQGGGDANTRTDKEEPGPAPSTYAAFPPNFIVECPDIPPGRAVILMPASQANYDRFGDHDNILSNNSDELSFRWFTRTLLTDASEEITDYVTWSVHTSSSTNILYMDAMLLDPDLLDPDYIYEDEMWSDPDNPASQRYLLRNHEDDFYDHVYQLTGRIPIRVSEYTGASKTATNFYNQPDMNAPELASWAAYGFLAQSDGHTEMIRPYVNFNLRAKDMDAANIANSQGDYTHSFYEAYGIDPDAMPTPEYYDDGKKLYIGGGYTSLSGGVESFILYDVPDDEVGLYSLGQLQHMKVSDHFDETGYAIGNSWASPFIERDAVYRQGAGDQHGLDGYLGNVDYSNVDISYLLNQALWDKYFFSTITNIGTEGDTAFHTPVNPVISFFGQDGTDLTFDDPETNAQYLYLNGAFNVNSTSVVAWEAVLSALNGIVLPEIGTTALAYPFFRFLDPVYGSDDPWAGFRELTQAEIHSLALAIVEQVKLRGPFLSLADFVNRELIAEDDDTDGLGLKGALQAAIDQTSINDTEEGDEVTETNTVDFPVTSHAVGGTADGIAGYLTQGDILTALGPLITVRSDTFLIRCYGDASGLTGEVEGRAWCEAVVQRMPEYVDSDSDAPEALPDDLAPTNQSFGRRYKIIAFHWLGPEDI